MNFAIDTIASQYAPHAFPAALSAQARRVGQLLPDYPYRLWAYHVHLGGEQLAIPVRLYFPHALPHTPTGDDIHDTMLLCLGSRHHDGHVRQACVARLVQRREAYHRHAYPRRRDYPASLALDYLRRSTPCWS